MKKTALPVFVLTVLFLLWVNGSFASSSEISRNRPNIVIFIADDLGYGELGCQGNPQIPTPFIDAISENGIRFTSGYVTAPNCSPSRAGLLVGLAGAASVAPAVRATRVDPVEALRSE